MYSPIIARAESPSHCSKKTPCILYWLPLLFSFAVLIEEMRILSCRTVFATSSEINSADISASLFSANEITSLLELQHKPSVFVNK